DGSFGAAGAAGFGAGGAGGFGTAGAAGFGAGAGAMPAGAAGFGATLRAGAGAGFGATAAPAARSTCSAWCSVSTLSKTWRIRPSLLTRNDLRSGPTPHAGFGFWPQAPYASWTAWSASVRSSNGRLYLTAKALCDDASSREIPRTSMPA